MAAPAVAALAPSSSVVVASALLGGAQMIVDSKALAELFDMLAGGSLGDGFAASLVALRACAGLAAAADLRGAAGTGGHRSLHQVGHLRRDIGRDPSRRTTARLVTGIVPCTAEQPPAASQQPRARRTTCRG